MVGGGAVRCPAALGRHATDRHHVAAGRVLREGARPPVLGQPSSLDYSYFDQPHARCFVHHSRAAVDKTTATAWPSRLHLSCPRSLPQAPQVGYSNPRLPQPPKQTESVDPLALLPGDKKYAASVCGTASIIHLAVEVSLHRGLSLSAADPPFLGEEFLPSPRDRTLTVFPAKHLVHLVQLSQGVRVRRISVRVRRRGWGMGLGDS